MGEKEQKRFCLWVISIGKSHRDYFQGSNHHVFSFCGDADKVSQDLQDLFHPLFPNSVHDQYLNSDQFVYIQGICKFDHAQADSQLVLGAVCISLFQNRGDFQ
jgi:hypothetical protein